MTADLTGTKALVTGADGFLGANLVRALVRAGASVHATVRRREAERLDGVSGALRLHVADVKDPSALRRVVAETRPSVVYHLAVRRAEAAPEDRAETFATNVLGAANLLDACASVPLRALIALGGSLENGPSASPIPESAEPRPHTFYGATKAAATLICQRTALAEDRPIVVLRPSVVYGPWQRPDVLVSKAIAAALTGGELTLTEPGHRRGWVFVDDVVDACLLAARRELPPGSVVNVGSPRQDTNEDVVAAVEAATGRPIRTARAALPPRPWDGLTWTPDIDRARELLGWEPRHSLELGIEKTVSWFREQPVVSST